MAREQRTAYVDVPDRGVLKLVPGKAPHWGLEPSSTSSRKEDTGDATKHITGTCGGNPLAAN